MKKKVKIHHLASNKPSQLYTDIKGNLGFSEEYITIPFGRVNQYLYFTSAEKIVLGDYYYRPGFNEIFRGSGFTKEDRKVVASSEKLNDVPQIPQSFIKEYVKLNGKIDEVEVEYELIESCLPMPKIHIRNDFWRIKVDLNNCVIIHPIKENLN